MSKPHAPWEQRLAELWPQLDHMEPGAFVAAIDALAAERRGPPLPT